MCGPHCQATPTPCPLKTDCPTRPHPVALWDGFTDTGVVILQGPFPRCQGASGGWWVVVLEGRLGVQRGLAQEVGRLFLRGMERNRAGQKGSAEYESTGGGPGGRQTVGGGPAGPAAAPIQWVLGSGSRNGPRLVKGRGEAVKIRHTEGRKTRRRGSLFVCWDADWVPSLPPQ